jgi:hypothetical protein
MPTARSGGPPRASLSTHDTLLDQSPALGAGVHSIPEGTAREDLQSLEKLRVHRLDVPAHRADHPVNHDLGWLDRRASHPTGTRRTTRPLWCRLPRKC